MPLLAHCAACRSTCACCTKYGRTSQAKSCYTQTCRHLHLRRHTCGTQCRCLCRLCRPGRWRPKLFFSWSWVCDCPARLAARNNI